MLITTIGCSICAQKSNNADLETTPHTKKYEHIVKCSNNDHNFRCLNLTVSSDLVN